MTEVRALEAMCSVHMTAIHGAVPQVPSPQVWPLGSCQGEAEKVSPLSREPCVGRPSVPGESQSAALTLQAQGGLGPGLLSRTFLGSFCQCGLCPAVPSSRGTEVWVTFLDLPKEAWLARL